MSEQKAVRQPSPTRRDFLKQSGVTLTTAALASAIAPRSYAAENNTIRVALIGCGGRGTGAALNALSTPGPMKLVALADAFEARVQNSYNSLSGRFGDQVDVPPERRFVGLDGFRKAIDCLEEGDLVLLAAPPAFRPQHLEYAVDKGRHVFMEKSFAVDAPGTRRVMKAGEEAKKKNLKIASGLMSRHYQPLEEAVARIHDGIIGDVITAWAYRAHGPVGFRPRAAGMSELAHQIQNYSCFTWVNGSFLLDWLIHNLDVCCWVKDAWPVSAQGQGGRQLRNEPDQLFDHYAVEYHFPDGTRLFAQGRHMANCWGFFGNVIHGAKGSAVLGEGISDPKIYNGFHQTAQSQIWNFEGSAANQYQVELDRLVDAIRNDKPYNEAERAAKAGMTGILGRMAAESGKLITWEEAMASDLELAPGLDDLTMDSPAPVMPDDNGNYPIAMPGFTNVL
jgi:myo-inositol 2-dehydrogenase / D-chiro-inositol 1-dehydrogenase